MSDLRAYLVNEDLEVFVLQTFLPSLTLLEVVEQADEVILAHRLVPLILVEVVEGNELSNQRVSILTPFLPFLSPAQQPPILFLRFNYYLFIHTENFLFYFLI